MGINIIKIMSINKLQKTPYIVPKEEIRKKIESNRSDFSKKIDSLSNGAINVSYEKPKLSDGIIFPKKSTYSISGIDTRDKYSSDFFDCTWLVCSGLTKSTNEKVSFLTHQDPLKILYDYQNSFTSDIEKQLVKISQISYNWSIDLWTFWWDIKNKDFDLYPYNYVKQIVLLKKIVWDILKINVRVLVWPSNVLEDEDIDAMEQSSHFYYDNNWSILHSYKPAQANNNTNISCYWYDVYDVLGNMKK